MKILVACEESQAVTIELRKLGYGAHELEQVVERKVRRVKCDTGCKWQLVQERKNQSDWDYFFEEDKECLSDFNFDAGLI